MHLGAALRWLRVQRTTWELGLGRRPGRLKTWALETAAEDVSVYDVRGVRRRTSTGAAWFPYQQAAVAPAPEFPPSCSYSGLGIDVKGLLVQKITFSSQSETIHHKSQDWGKGRGGGTSAVEKLQPHSWPGYASGRSCGLPLALWGWRLLFGHRHSLLCRQHGCLREPGSSVCGHIPRNARDVSRTQNCSGRS